MVSTIKFLFYHNILCIILPPPYLLCLKIEQIMITNLFLLGYPEYSKNSLTFNYFLQGLYSAIVQTGLPVERFQPDEKSIIHQHVH